MKNLRTIIVVGIVLPSVIALAIGCGLLLGWQRFEQTKESVDLTYESYQKNRETVAKIAPSLPMSQTKIAKFTALLGVDQSAELANGLKTIEANLSPSDGKRVGYNKLDQGGLPGVSIPSENISISWTGKFSNLQGAFLQFEELKPNLFLTNLSIESSAQRTVSITQQYVAFRADLATPNPQ